MRVLDWRELLEGALARLYPPPLPKTAVTIGVFDGIHLGHQALISEIVRQAPLVPTAITFRRNPKEVLGKCREGNILSLKRRLAILESLGVELTVLIDFSEEFSKLTGRDFFTLLMKWGNPGYITVGSNFRCGYRSDTGAEDIKKLCGEIPVETLAPVLAQANAQDGEDSGGGDPISSSRIRQAILLGDMPRAEAMLGRRVEFDIAGLKRTAKAGGDFFSIQSAGLLKPAPGTYLGRIVGKGFPIEAVIVVSEGGFLVVPGAGDAEAERIEFIRRADQKPC